jgi:hypothetical protein
MGVIYLVVSNLTQFVKIGFTISSKKLYNRYKTYVGRNMLIYVWDVYYSRLRNKKWREMESAVFKRFADYRMFDDLELFRLFDRGDSKKNMIEYYRQGITSYCEEDQFRNSVYQRGKQKRAEWANNSLSQEAASQHSQSVSLIEDAKGGNLITNCMLGEDAFDEYLSSDPNDKIVDSRTLGLQDIHIEELFQQQMKACDRNSVNGFDGDDDSGFKSDGSKNDGTESDGSKSAGSKSDGSKSDASKSDGSESDGSESDGSKSAGSKSDGSESDGSKSDGSESDGSKTDGSESDGSESDGSKTAGSKSDGSESDGSKSDGSKSDGSDMNVARKSSAKVNNFLVLLYNCG